MYVGADEKKIGDAEVLVRRLTRQSRDPSYVTRLLQEAIVHDGTLKLSVALERAATIKLDNETVAGARVLLQQRIRDEERRKILTKLADAARMRLVYK